MKEKKDDLLFNFIAPFYGLFYNFQKKWYTDIINSVQNKLDIYAFDSIIDIGCGTGALSSVLDDGGMDVTGIDPAINMLNIAMDKSENGEIKFIHADVLEGLSFQIKVLI